MIHIIKVDVCMWVIVDVHDYHSVYLVIKCALRHGGADKVVINKALGFGLRPSPATSALIKHYDINAVTVHYSKVYELKTYTINRTVMQ